MKKECIVVTGFGVVSGLANQVDRFWQKIQQQQSAVTVCDTPSLKEIPLAGWAPVPNWQAPAGTEAKDRQIQFALHAAAEAFNQAQLQHKQDKNSLGVYLSSSKGGMQTLNQVKFDAPLFLENFLPSAPSIEVAKTLDCRGPVQNFVSACASGAHAVMMAARCIQQHPETTILAGSTEASLTPLVLGGFFNMGVLARQNGRPCQNVFAPFDQSRQGFIAGEGAAVLVLESLSEAEKRGAAPLAEVLGAAAGGDPNHLTRFDPSGQTIAQTILKACANAQVVPEEIDYVNLHGTATKENDTIETQAIKQVWKEKKPLFSATKPMTGHLLGASGAIEALITVLALKEQFIPPTLNLMCPDRACNFDLTPLKGVQRPIQTALSLSYGFGGHIGALIFKRI